MKRWLFVITVVIVALLAADSLTAINLTQPLRQAGFSLFRRGASTSETDALFPTGDPALRAEYVALSDRVALEKENQNLRELLTFQKKSARTLLVANVLYRDALIPSYFYIDVGSNDGARVQPGQAVVTRDGLLIGKIAAVHDTTAQVERVSGAGSKIPASFMHGSSTAGLLRGDNGPLLHLELIPPDIEVTKGEIIVTANTDTHVPDGLLVGVVHAVDKTTDPLFQSASIIPLVPSDQLPRIVSIIVQE